MKNMKLKVRIIENFGNQANFAEVVRKHEPIVSRVINNRHKLPLEEQTRWAAILNCKPEDIFQAV